MGNSNKNTVPMMIRKEWSISIINVSSFAHSNGLSNPLRPHFLSFFLSFTRSNNNNDRNIFGVTWFNSNRILYCFWFKIAVCLNMSAIRSRVCCGHIYAPTRMGNENEKRDKTQQNYRLLIGIPPDTGFFPPYNKKAPWGKRTHTKSSRKITYWL